MAAIFEEFANGDAFNASDFNILAMRQAIIACDNQTDRDSILTPQEGMTVYRKDTNNFETYDGAAWINAITNKYKIGSFTASASTGNQSITGVGFKPKKLTLMNLNDSASNAVQSVGVTDGTNQFSVTSAARNGFTAQTDGDTAKCYLTKSINAGGTFSTDAAANIVSFDTDGFTVNWTTAFAHTVGYIAEG